MEHISTYFKIENDVLYIKGQRDALLIIEEKIREAEEKIREEQRKFYKTEQLKLETEQLKLETEQLKLETEQLKLETEQLIKQYQHDVITNLILSTNLPNETIANIANVTLSFVEDLRKTLTPN
jgi:hypothetical protein